MTYVIKDTRNERQDGFPSYVCNGSETCLNRVVARHFNTKRDAQRVLKQWGKLMDYACPEVWLSIVPVHPCERFYDIRVKSTR